MAVRIRATGTDVQVESGFVQVQHLVGPCDAVFLTHGAPASDKMVDSLHAGGLIAAEIALLRSTTAEPILR